jgi:hypothetical protein
MTTSEILDIDPAELRSGIGDRVFQVHHHLAGHPLLELEALAELADFLPERLVEHHLGDVPTLLPGGGAPRVDLSPGDVARTIDTNGSWMVIQQIQLHPGYRALLDQMLDQVEPLLAPRDLPMTHRVGFVFLSAAKAVAPAHIDPEHNLLLQVQGTKQITIGSWERADDQQRVLERYFTEGQQHVPALPGESQTLDLGPGDGVHVPIYAPHWVQNGAARCVALAITFHTAGVLRTERVHAFNAHLRKLGVHPRPPGRVRSIDAAKAGAIRSWEATRGRLRKRTG